MDDHPLPSASSEPQSGDPAEDTRSNVVYQKIVSRLALSDVKFLRVAWCDTANVIRAKAAYVPRLEGVYKDGIALCVGNQVI